MNIIERLTKILSINESYYFLNNINNKLNYIKIKFILKIFFQNSIIFFL